MESDPICCQRLADLALAWAVELDEISETSTSLIGYGSHHSLPVVLKLIKAPGDEWNTGQVLSAFEGRGVVSVHRHLPGAVLIERLEPGTPLVEWSLSGRDDEATTVLAEVIGAMSPRLGATGSPTVHDWGRGFDRYLATGDTRLPRDLVLDAARVYAHLASSQTAPRLLHGDLHHFNVLFDQRRGWTAIDPKGVVGELEYELGAALRNPFDRPDLFAAPGAVERRLARFAALIGFDPGRALSWAFAQAVLSAIWQIEDDCPPLGTSYPSLELAEAIRPLLR
jgi:streptomycin 6-kinase